MYGSNLIRVTRRPRDSSSAAREAADIPLPRDETTPPVINAYLGSFPSGISVQYGVLLAARAPVHSN